jgi:hypothetical protein
MSLSALEKIQAIQDKANKEIEALKAEAVSDLARKIAAVKGELSALQAEYETLTGKPAKEGKTRKRLSAEEKAALVATVTDFIKAAKEGISFGEVAKHAGESDSAVRAAIKSAKGIKSVGSRAATKYFIK